MNSASTPARRRGPLLRKSGSGCQDCRLRKVKCDETKPVCSNCRRRYTDIQRCDWSTAISRKSIQNSRRATSSQSLGHGDLHDVLTCTTNAHILSPSLYPTSQPSSKSSTSRWRSLELRLMYHYTAVVSHTMPGCNGAPTDAWQRTIPQLSFESEMVLNSMLALSALHLHAHSQHDPEMAIALRRYLDRSLVNHRQALSNPGEELLEQIWLSAIMLSHMCWLLAHQAQPNEMYELPLQAFTMLEGVGVLFEQKIAFLSPRGYNWIGDEAISDIAPKAKLTVAAQIQLQSIEEDLTRLLDAFDVASMPDVDKSVYIEAKDYLQHHYQMFFSGADPKTFQRFIRFTVAKCQPGYRKKLEQYDPLAMALMARMLVLLSGPEQAWWINGKGSYEVIGRDIWGIRELMPANLRWAMDWPCKVLEREIILIRDEQTFD